jgi:hypothetical protein
MTNIRRWPLSIMIILALCPAYLKAQETTKHYPELSNQRPKPHCARRLPAISQSLCRRTFGLSNPDVLSTAASLFAGNTHLPLFSATDMIKKLIGCRTLLTFSGHVPQRVRLRE